MSGTLYVVATPIGNLEDITLRALRILRDVSLIAAEDTRHTAKLLNHHGIATPTVSFHEHNTRRRLPELIRRLTSGEDVALVSDAGTPIISDPGFELVRASLEAGVRVEPIPGASAPLAALVASGFPAEPVTILGFAPARSTSRKAFLAAISAVPHTLVFFETPHRIQALLADAQSVLGNRLLCVARELTKIHQEIVRGTARELAERLSSLRGEFTIVVAPLDDTVDSDVKAADPAVIVAEFRQMTDSRGCSRREAIEELSRRYGRRSREIYATIERHKTGAP